MADPFDEIRRRVDAKSREREQSLGVARRRRDQLDDLHRTWGALAKPVLTDLRDAAYPGMCVGDLHRMTDEPSCSWAIGEKLPLYEGRNVVTVSLAKDHGDHLVGVNMNYLVHDPDGFARRPTLFSFSLYRHEYGDRYGSGQWHWRHICSGTGGQSPRQLAEAIVAAMRTHDLP